MTPKEFHKCSWAEISRQTGVSPVLLSNYAHRRRSPGIRTITKMATRLGLTIDDFLREFEIKVANHIPPKKKNHC